MIGQNEIKENQKEFNKLFDNSKKLLKKFITNQIKVLKFLFKSHKFYYLINKIKK